MCTVVRNEGNNNWDNHWICYSTGGWNGQYLAHKKSLPEAIFIRYIVSHGAVGQKTAVYLVSVGLLADSRIAIPSCEYTMCFIDLVYAAVK